MYVSQVSARNFKGGAFTHNLGPITVILGDNFTGKTSIPDAIRLALSGYLPNIGKTAGALYGALATNPDEAGIMTVAVEFDNERRSSITFARTAKGATSVEGAVPADLALNPMLLDVRTFFTLTAAQRTSAIFEAAGKVDLKAEAIEEVLWKIDASPAKVRDETVRGLLEDVKREFKKSGATPQQAVALLVPEWTTSMKEAKAKHKAAAGAFAGMKLPARIPTVPDNLAALRAERDELNQAKGKLLALLREDTLVKSLESGIKAAEERLTAARAAMNETPDPGPEPVQPALLAEYDKIVSKLEEISEAVSKLEAERSKISEDVEALKGVGICPTCGGTEGMAKVVKRYEDKFAELSAAIDRLDAEHAELIAPFEDVRSVAAQHDEAVENHAAAVQALAQAVRAVSAGEEEITAMKAQLASAQGDRAEEVERLNQQVAKLPAILTELTAAEAAEVEARNYERLLREREAMETTVLREECRATVYDGAVKALNKVIRVQSEIAFERVLQLSEDFTQDLIPSSLEFRDGELGRRGENDGWIPHESFSGTEQLLAYAGFSVALARMAPFKLVVLDEMGRLSPDRRAQVLIRMEELIAGGKLDQVILIDATPPNRLFDSAGKELIESTYGTACAKIIL